MFELDRKKLRQSRKNARYTLAEAGKFIGGETYNKLFSIEKGKTKNLTAEDLFVLAKIYQVDPTELVVPKQ